LQSMLFRSLYSRARFRHLFGPIQHEHTCLEKRPTRRHATILGL
jgi:hypothetical protein